MGERPRKSHPALELFDRQIQDLGSKRKNFKVIEAERVVALEGKKVTSVVYSGEKASSRDYFRFTLVEFTEAPALIPVVLQGSIPSYWSENKTVLEAITALARVAAASRPTPR